MAPETKAREKLDAWLKDHTVTGLASVIGVTQPSVSEWRIRSTRPSFEHRTAIERVTGIPATDWETDKERATREKREKRLSEYEPPPTDADLDPTEPDAEPLTAPETPDVKCEGAA